MRQVPGMPDRESPKHGKRRLEAQQDAPIVENPDSTALLRSQSPDPPTLKRQATQVDDVLETLAASGGLMQDDHDRHNAEVVKVAPESDFAIRWSFTLGVLNACATSFVVGRPFGVYWYFLKAVVLLTYRWFSFKKAGQHYYMVDFCYVCNIMLCVYIAAALLGHGTEEWAVTLFKALFAMTNGPLLWAIPLFRNQLKFHSLQHVISVFIHISPASVTYAIRWCLDPAVYGVSQVDAGSESYLSLLSQLEGAALVPYYLLWLVAYYFIVFCVRSKRINDKQYETLFSYIMEPARRHPVRRVLTSITTVPWLQKIVYLGLHLALGLVTMALTPLLWQHLWLHTAFLIAILGSACWNASKGYLRLARPQRTPKAA